MDSIAIIIGIAALTIGILAGKFVFAKNTQKEVEDAQKKILDVERQISDAKNQAQNIVKEAQLKAENIKKEKELVTYLDKWLYVLNNLYILDKIPAKTKEKIF